MCTWDGPNQACLVVLCGLPGAGKSALAEGWKMEKEEVHVASVDRALAKRGAWNAEGWKRAGREVKRDVRERMDRARRDPTTKHVVVVDDNMHLRSMRKEYFRIARERESNPDAC